ncbi:NADP-dependent glyceraldehyde-3-phosphate dehydrogenase [Rubripirellula tenax]|uniref:NADP-dependent glyceraldehyde-3-phosphate dehydrogenase n=1 Tax=Rubripirellula tenax TaxID=2528015 RepID=A0A5C6EMI6_9BACT|nr:aldehyde dehydrogenase family protein [Rubripirellula tenax]TWU48851.1 NADP-dependent glyceraldehyde-3-phosphate dehydrogenase [Rubripirellula tenax]
MQHRTELNPWGETTTKAATKTRCRVIASVAHQLASATTEFTRLCASDQRCDPVETITSELLPLCAALRWIGRSGPRVLSPRRVGFAGRPMWLAGVQSHVERQPHGLVLVLGTWNYPLLLPGVQMAQALAAGNRVLVKPAAGCELATARLVRAFYDAGVPPESLNPINSSTESATAAMDAGVDLIVLTGSAETGRRVLERASQSLTPVIAELSGCDAVIVLPDADIERAAQAIVFGLTFNSGATCIAPRRLIADEPTADRLLQAIRSRLATSPSVVVHSSARMAVADVIRRSLSEGCVDALGNVDVDALATSGRMLPAVLDQVVPDHPVATADIFAPVTSIMRVEQIVDAVGIVNDCRYRLAASIFGNRVAAAEMAKRLSVGTVTLNDLIVPTADPRLPFGGRGDSGFGVTRGVEGLLSMTTPKVVSERTGSWAPHLRARTENDERILSAMVGWLHGTASLRLASLKRMVRRDE